MGVNKSIGHIKKNIGHVNKTIQSEEMEIINLSTTCNKEADKEKETSSDYDIHRYERVKNVLH